MLFNSSITLSVWEINYTLGQNDPHDFKQLPQRHYAFFSVKKY